MLQCFVIDFLEEALKSGALRPFGDQFGQTGLCAGSNILVDQVLGSGLIELLGSETQRLVCGSCVTRFRSGTSLLHGGSQCGSTGTIMQATLFTLTKSFFCAGCIRHGNLESSFNVLSAETGSHFFAVTTNRNEQDNLFSEMPPV